MNVTLVSIGEPVPVPGYAGRRRLRSGLLTPYLRQLGAGVTWWTGTFDYARKIHHYPADTTADVDDGYRLHLLHSIGYRRNVSVGRGLDDLQLARKLARGLGAAPRADVILVVNTPVFVARAAVAHAHARGIPVVVDVRDLWPDIFVAAAPAPLKPLAWLGLALQRPAARATYRRADAIVGITEPYLRWGLAYAGRDLGARDRVFPLANARRRLAADAVAAAESHWDRLGVTADAFAIAYVGVLTGKVDLAPVIVAVRQIDDPDLRLVVGGDGEQLPALRRLAGGDPRIVLPGWVDEAQVQTLFSRSALGLAPYRNRRDYGMSVPAKVADYLAFGLPYLTPLGGVLERLTRSHACGYFCSAPTAAAYREQILRARDDALERRARSKACLALFETSLDADQVYGEFARHLLAIAAGERFEGDPSATFPGF